jgi:16S rRNA (guanine527-N7)-methyltransferase
MSASVAKIVQQGAAGLGVALPPDAPAAFEAYDGFLAKQGETVNLTAIKGAGDVARLHFLDSLALLNVVAFAGARVIDVGSGAGFLGVPMIIAEPTIDVTLLDAARKRVEFLKRLCSLLDIKADCIQARAEESSRDPNMREAFDIALSRAVARLNVLCELCLPFVRVGGLFIASKGAGTDGEIDEARGAMATLGAELQGISEYDIRGADGIRRAVVIRKTSATPKGYPRRFARIKSKPL